MDTQWPSGIKYIVTPRVCLEYWGHVTVHGWRHTLDSLNWYIYRGVTRNHSILYWVVTSWYIRVENTEKPFVNVSSIWICLIQWVQSYFKLSEGLQLFGCLFKYNVHNCTLSLQLLFARLKYSVYNCSFKLRGVLQLFYFVCLRWIPLLSLTRLGVLQGWKPYD